MTDQQTQWTTVTPSGIEVMYQAAPKRLYRVRATYDGPDSPLMEWAEVPSVTTVLGVLDKPALPWWGMGVGVEGALALHNMGILRSMQVGHQMALCYEGELGQWYVAGKEQVIELLGKHKLTVNHVRDKAGDRGTAVHDALEHWAGTGDLPDPGIFPPNEQGYVLGLIAFLQDAMLEPVASEVMVGSVEHGFAGRYDLRAKTTQDRQIVVHRTPKRGPQYATLRGGMQLLTDLKTSSGVYPTHAKQLEGYEIASIESGYDPTDARGILHVGPEGTYEFVRSWATAHDFLTTLAEYTSQGDMKSRKG